LILKATKTKKVADITIKIQFINSPFDKNAVVKKVNNQLTLEDLVKEIEKEFGESVLQSSKKLKFQGLTRAVTQEEFNKVTLAQFGVENNGSIRLIFEITNQIETKKENTTLKSESKSESSVSMKKESSTELNDDSQIKQEDVVDSKVEPIPERKTSNESSSEKAKSSDFKEDKMEIDEPEQQTTSQSQSKKEPTSEKVEKHVYVYKAPEVPVKTDEPEEEEYELTVSHARQYQNILSQRAHESYKTKRLRQEANKKKITNIEIRIRFPDDNHLQINFNPNEKNKDLYNLVSTTLVNQSSFILSVPYPPKDIINDDTKLIENFESRNLLLFKSEQSTGPFLKDEYLKKAKDFKEAEDVKLELERQDKKQEVEEDATNDSQIQNGVLPKKKETNFGSKSSSTDKEVKKVPKWLKLGKK